MSDIDNIKARQMSWFLRAPEAAHGLCGFVHLLSSKQTAIYLGFCLQPVFQLIPGHESSLLRPVVSRRGGKLLAVVKIHEHLAVAKLMQISLNRVIAPGAHVGRFIARR